MFKCLVNGYQYPFHLDILKALEKKNILKITHWIQRPELFNDLDRDFESVKKYNYYDCIRAKYHENHLKKTVNKEIDQIFFNEKRNLLNMASRYNYYQNLSERDMMQFIEIHKNYWSSFFSENEIDLILFEEIPHLLYDYCLYLIARSYKKKILIKEFANKLNSVVFIDDVYSRSKIGKNYYLKKNTPSQAIDEFISKVRGVSHNEALDIIEKKTFELLKNSFFKKISRKFVYVFSNFRKYLFFKLKNEFLFKKNNFFLSKNSYVTEFERDIFRLKSFFKNKKLTKIYNSKKTIVKKISKEKYVLFCSQMQPEKTTFPEAGDFQDNIELLKIIRDNLPPNVKIFYREHPATFMYFHNCYMYRNSKYYENICSNKNTFLVPYNDDIFKYIDNSLAVITTTGTSGIEAAIRGKTVINFGSAWYSACKSIINIKSKKELYKLENIFKFKTDLNDIRNFLYYLDYNYLRSELEIRSGDFVYNYKNKKLFSENFKKKNFSFYKSEIKKYEKYFVKALSNENFR